MAGVPQCVDELAKHDHTLEFRTRLPASSEKPAAWPAARMLLVSPAHGVTRQRLRGRSRS
jgi:hypothetical protein